MTTISNEIQAWANEADGELQLNTLCYRVMVMVAYLGDEGKPVHEANDLGTAYAIGSALGHITVKKNDGAVAYIVGAYNELKKYFKSNPLQQGE
jgi:hypothetical protein